MTVRRDGEWWFFEIPAINLSGQASRLSEVESEARDIIATWLQVDPTTITVTLDVVVPDAMDQPKLPEQTELPRDIAGYQAVKSADDGGRVSELETLENAGDAQEAAEILARIESGQERTYTTAGVTAELGVTLARASIVARLQEVLGRDVVAIITGKTPRQVSRWFTGEATPPVHVQRILCDTFRVVKLLAEVDPDEVVRAWFIGMNTQLNDAAPAEVIAEGRVRDVMAAARSYVNAS